MQSQNGFRKNSGPNYKSDKQEFIEIEQSHAGWYVFVDMSIYKLTLD